MLQRRVSPLQSPVQAAQMRPRRHSCVLAQAPHRPVALLPHWSIGTSVQEAVRRRKDGSLVHVNVSTKAVRDASGQVL